MLAHCQSNVNTASPSQLIPSHQGPRTDFHGAGLGTCPSLEPDLVLCPTLEIGSWGTSPKPHGLRWGRRRLSSRKLGCYYLKTEDGYRSVRKLPPWQTRAHPSLCVTSGQPFPYGGLTVLLWKMDRGLLNSNIPEFWDSFQNWWLPPQSQGSSGASGDGGERHPGPSRPRAWEHA